MKAQLKSMNRKSLIMVGIETKRTIKNPKGILSKEELLTAVARKLETFNSNYKVEVVDANVVEVLSETKELKKVVRRVRVSVEMIQIIAEVV